MNDNVDQKIDTLLTELEQFGEDSEELEYWRSILPYMELEEKTELVANLEVEKLSLQKIEHKTLSEEEEALLKQDAQLLGDLKTQHIQKEQQEKHQQEQENIEIIRNNITHL